MWLSERCIWGRDRRNFGENNEKAWKSKTKAVSRAQPPSHGHAYTLIAMLKFADIVTRPRAACKTKVYINFRWYTVCYRQDSGI